MRLRKLRAAGFPAFPREVEVDLDALGDAALVAVTGSNGAGKSTLLELFPAALFREGPTRGALAKLANARDAFVEVTVENGAPYTIRQLVDAVSGKGETLITNGAGTPVIESAKLREADAWIRSHLPSPDVLYASTFAAQGSGGFIDLSPTERKKVLLRVLGIEHLERLAEGARERVREAKARLATAEARLADERRRGGFDPDVVITGPGGAGTIAGVFVGVDPDPIRRAQSAVEDARIVVDDYEGALATARLALADAEAAAADATALLRDHERKRLEAADLRRRAVDLDAKAAAEGGKVVDLEKRITNNEAVLARADEIRAAVARDAALAAELAALDGQVAEIRARQQAPRDRVAQAGRDVTKARADLAAAQGAVLRLEAVLADRGAVIAAVANLPGAQRRVAELEAQVAAAETELEAARGKTLATAEGRIEGLRGGLEAIARDDANASLVAGRTLAADDQAVKAAAEVPAEIRRLTDEKAALVRDLATTRRTVTEYERAASRAGEMERAASDLETARLEVGSAERALPVAEQARAEAQAELETLEQEVVALAQRKPGLGPERAALAPTLKLADPLAQAEARLEELRPQLEGARAAGNKLAAEAQQLRDQAAAVDPGAAPAAPDLDAVRARVAAAEKAARDAHAAVAVAEQNLQAAREAAARVAALEADRDGIFAELADWTRLAADLGKNGLQALEVDAAGPELTTMANDLLHAAFGPRFTIAIDTTRTGADGRELEACEVRVLDTERGREGTAETFSGGERVVIGEAIALALSMLACRRAGIERPTLVRDESGAALDAANGRAYVAMLRRAVQLIGADRCLYVSHTPELQELADVRLHVEAGRVVVR